MKQKSIFIGLMGILIFFGIAAAEVSAQAKNLVVTGITGHTGNVMAVVTPDANDPVGSSVAIAQAGIAKNGLTFQLLNSKNEKQQWTGSGQYYVLLIFEGSGNAIYAKVHTITTATTTIAYNQFELIAEGSGNSNNKSKADNSPKTLTITGITGHSGNVMAVIASDANKLTDTLAAVAEASISKNSITFQLMNAKNEKQRWTESGEYYIVLIFEGSGNARYNYTQGGRNMVKYNIATAATTLKYDQFRAAASTTSSSSSSSSISSNTYINSQNHQREAQGLAQVKQ